LKKKALVSRRLLTPYLLNHADCESFVSAGGLRGIVGDLPEWCKRPEFETVLWLNGVITTLWPHLSAGKGLSQSPHSASLIAHTRLTLSFLPRALSQKIGTALGKIVGKISPLGISLSFREFALGNESLNVLSVRKASSNFTSSKTTTSGDDEVVLDLDVRWCGDPTVVLDVRVMGLTLQVRLQELQLVGPLRLVLGGFDDRMPCFHLMKIAFVEQPLVDFSLSLVGGDIEMFPGVKESITEIIAKGLAKAIVWPKYVKVPIANKNGKAGVSQGDARAVLEVTLVKGNNLRNVRAFGKSDPFVTSKVTGSSRTVKKSSVVVGSRNPRWNETFKLIIDDPTTQTVSINVSDYSPFAEDAGVRQLGKTLLKINGACFGWQRVMRRRVYNIGGVRKTYKKGAKLERAVTTGKYFPITTFRLPDRPIETDTFFFIGPGADTDDSDFSLFQTTMGTGRVSLKNLVPFQETARRVILTKSAYSIINDSGLGLGSNDPRSKRKANAAGTLDVRLRLVPLSADITRTARALATTAAAVTRALNEHRASLGVVDKKTLVKRMLEKHDKRETEADRVARAKKAEQKKKADDVEVLVRGVLGGEADKILDSGQNEIATATPSVDFHRLRPHLYGLLHVTLVRGEGLVPKDTSGLSDPYFELSLNAQKWRSQTARQTLNPTFDACFEFFVTPDDFLTPGVSLNLECWDEDIVGKDFMGDARIVLRNVVRKSLTALGETVFERVALGGVESGYVLSFPNPGTLWRPD
tara:strand:+ start:1049 stop:3310 length:2262 start_codon:yes stop_codon:yes gene_type:complete